MNRGEAKAIILGSVSKDNEDCPCVAKFEVESEDNICLDDFLRYLNRLHTLLLFIYLFFPFLMIFCINYAFIRCLDFSAGYLRNRGRSSCSTLTVDEEGKKTTIQHYFWNLSAAAMVVGTAAYVKSLHPTWSPSARDALT